MDWQQVDTNSLNRPRPTQIRGVNVIVYFGQEDMPVGIRGGYDATRKKFVIEFKYDASEEPKKLLAFQPHVSLTVGQTSERLYEVELDVDKMDVQVVRLLTDVDTVLNQLPNRAREIGLDRLDNYVAASGAFKQVRKKLETAIAP